MLFPSCPTDAWLDDVRVSDWTRYHLLPTFALDWAEKYRHHSTSADHPALAGAELDMDAIVLSFKDEIEEIEDGFAARVGILKTNAILKADADKRKAQGLDGEEEEESMFPIGAIWGNSDAEAPAEALGANVILEKGKQQILEALASASSVVVPSPSIASTASGVVESASSVLADASEAVFGAATTSAGNVVNQATASVASALSDASEAVLGAATTSAGNVVSQATASASSLLSSASEAVLGAATTSAGNPLIPSPIASAASYAVEAKDAVSSNCVTYASSASSVLEDASSSIHSATRVVVKAAGGSPTPETVGEYVEDVKDRVSEVAAKATDAVRQAVGREEL